MNEEQILNLKKELSSPKKIVIVPHKNPDGDAVGSVTALYGYLIQSGHHVAMVSPNDFPLFLKWMEYSDLFINYEQDQLKADTLLQEADLIFNLDHNAFHRAGMMEKALEEATSTFVMIDHHQQPDDFATYMYSDTSMSSTCEMIYHFLDMMEDTDKITPEMATAMYTGILTDTGSFKYKSTTSTTLRVAAHLVDNGANSEDINRKIYDVNTPSRMKLLGVALSNLVILEKYRTAYITLSQKELDDNNFRKGDTEGFVNYALSLDGIVFAQIFIEKASESIIKTSLRSKGDFDVNKMARENWDGGGHQNAAGGKSELSMEETVNKLISILPTYENELHAVVI
ncbi:phosphoesterase RecJ-like protein [Nonlabens dokdonensis]|jgi:phosphoesterase RecJ-like protein|uniref:Phosphoesterase, DHH family n=2 Tax=Nonlabens dokdonensis TaxID=328515 RepID=L7WHF0_NONDD|nr:bifunctional oligoribonuclease/PAP phosphatase NrnA [Nonlabens dokdonensis]AGC78403.1 phosphoesterase, DHH family [Nonlabens dokdonensis DSW-6]PZX38151.1 phosphoesterase RecJ-like protein [Nonlabens dokdonensis]